MPQPLTFVGTLSLTVCLLSCQSGDNNAVDDAAKEPAKKIGSTLNDKHTLEISDIPSDALLSIKALHPDFVPEAVDKEFKHGKTYLDIEGESAGAEIEIDFLQTTSGWKIVEIQRDLSWEQLPPSVANELKSKAPRFEPLRIIESKQHGTPITVYEFYAVDSGGIESRKEVKLEDDTATLLDEEWQH